MKTKAKFGIGVAIILVTLSCLAYVGAQQSKTYYHTISEIPTLNGSALHQRLRVGGDVKNGSIQHYSGRVDFVLVEQGKTLPVSYVGTDPLPDTFQGWCAMPRRRQSAARRDDLWPRRFKPSARLSMRRRRRARRSRRTGDSYQNGKS